MYINELILKSKKQACFCTFFQGLIFLKKVQNGNYPELVFKQIYKILRGFARGKLTAEAI
ncbi:MAG TPA: hypothetical protein DCO83_08680 [Mucilaginibacter sp.]|nr:hypothetical protein [Mucilaginibacter sp.]